MRLLLDESLPSRLRRSLPGHSVNTVVEMHSNELPHLLPLIPLLEETLATLQPCTYARVGP